MRAGGGFTLIETMVTVAIAAVLLTIAVPSFLTFIQNARFNSQTSDVTTALMYARSEAVARNQTVTICSVPSYFDVAECPTPSNPSIAPGPNCICSGSTNWEPGYAVFVDSNGNGAIDTGEPVLRAYPVLAGGNTLRGANASVTFTSNGYVSGLGTSSLRLCDARGTTKSRRVVLTGQASPSYCSCDTSSISPPVCPASAGCGTVCP